MPNSKTMKTILTFLILLVGLTGINTASAQDEWVLVTEQDGIQFLSKSKVSRLNQEVSTILKLMNNNDYDVVVKYVPTSICGDIENMDREETIALDRKGGSSLHTLPPCTGGQPKLKIVKLIVDRK
jgi:hypothetical protein